MTSSDRPGPNIGTRILEDHPDVRIWELSLEPGESSEWHAHQTAYVYIVVEPAPLFTEYADGTQKTYESCAGEYAILNPSTHRVTNVGKTRYRNIIVELKGAKHE